MKDIILVEKKELQEKISKLEIKEALFLDDIVILKSETKGDLIKEIKSAKGKKFLIFKPKTEEMLRFALEKTNVNLVYGLEQINPKDSMHYLKAGLDQIIAKIAFENDKMIGFAFSEILNSKIQGRLLGRIRHNMKLCKKFKVNYILGSFATKESELRSRKDLDALKRILIKNN